MVTGGVEHHPDEFDEPADGGGGAVDSVNGETGAVTLSAADVSAAPATSSVNVTATRAAIGGRLGWAFGQWLTQLLLSR
mgnify:CR=1 FL=1